MNAHNVLRAAWNADAYRSAVATSIRDIQRATGHTLIEIAESIDASLGTVSNAVNCKADLTAPYLFRLGAVYGASFVNPCLALMGAQAAPIEHKRLRDILPLGMKLFHKIAAARDPDGPGGVVEVPQERAGYLGDAKALHHELGCHIAATEMELA